MAIMEHPLWMTWVHLYREVEEEFGIRYTRQQLVRGFRRFLRDMESGREQRSA